VVGSFNLDHVVTVTRLPRAGETISGHGYVTVPGGKGLNQAVAACRQGAAVVVAGCLGDDAPGHALLAAMRQEGIDVSRVRTVPGEPSGTALITVAGDGGNTVVVASGANAMVAASDVAGVEEALCPGGVLVAQMEIPLGAVSAALLSGRQRGATTVLNPSPVQLGTGPELLGLVDVVVPNELEALEMSGCRTAYEAVEWLLRQGCGAVALTMGKAGALAGSQGQGIVEVPAFPVDVLDPTGAGDAFCGALAASLAGGLGLVDAVRRGCAAGALAATVLGAVPSLPGAVATDRLIDSQS